MVKKRSVCAKTRSWERVVKLVRQMMDERESMKKAVCRMEEEERLKRVGTRAVGE